MRCLDYDQTFTVKGGSLRVLMLHEAIRPYIYIINYTPYGKEIKKFIDMCVVTSDVEYYELVNTYISYKDIPTIRFISSVSPSEIVGEITDFVSSLQDLGRFNIEIRSDRLTIRRLGDELPNKNWSLKDNYDPENHSVSLTIVVSDRFCVGDLPDIISDIVLATHDKKYHTHKYRKNNVAIRLLLDIVPLDLRTDMVVYPWFTAVTIRYPSYLKGLSSKDGGIVLW